MAEPVRVRRLTDQEGQRLQQIVRRGSTNAVRCRRAMMLPASADGNRVPVIAQLVAADEDTVRDVIHRFNEIGLACLDPRWAGGRPPTASRSWTGSSTSWTLRTQGTRPHTKGERHPLGRAPPQHRSLTDRELAQPQRIMGPLVAKRGRPKRCEDDLGWADPKPRTGPVQEKDGARGERLRRRTARSPPRRR